ncbi:MAG TPA: response regulator [Methylomirabilota bacterium]|nr:response regulator [Methylomirabilota bacterium]
MTIGPCRVMVLEDEFFIADEIAYILETAGFAVVGPVATVAEALGTLADGPVDAAVIDANLRGESSVAVAAALRREGIPFVVCSGYRVEDLIPTFGSVTLVAKPVHSGRLVTALKSSLEASEGKV